VPDGDDVVMKGSDNEVRGERSFSAFPHVRAKLCRASGDIPVEPPPCRNWRCVPLRLRQKSSTKQFTCKRWLPSPTWPSCRNAPPASLDSTAPRRCHRSAQGLLFAQFTSLWGPSLSVSQGAHPLTRCQQTFNDSSPVSVVMSFGLPA
jgi:hypothetical protein